MPPNHNRNETQTAERTIDTEDRSASYGRVQVRAFDADALRAVCPVWDQLPAEQRLAALSLVRPTNTTHTHNTVCVGKHEWNIQGMDRTLDVEDVTISLAVGDDNATAPNYENRSLNNEGYRTAVAFSDPRGTDIRYTTLLGANEANDLDAVRELGIVIETERTGGREGDSYLLNHALIPPEAKSSSTALTFRSTLGFEPAGSGGGSS